MDRKPLLDVLRRRLREFRSATAGNVTITFALATLPIVGFVGAAVDYSRANSVKAAMQGAADSTALMLSKTAAGQNSTQLNEKANDYFKALFTRSEASSLVVTAAYNADSGSQVTVNASSAVKTQFMQMLGFSSLKVAVDSQVRWGTAKLQVALALDTTGSMADNNKMPSLKTAAKDFIDILKDAAKNPGDVRIAIVPFAKYVNVGKSNHNDNWLDWDDWDDDNGDDVNKTTCVNVKTGKSGKKVKKCTTSTTWVPDNHNTWNGCVTDRDQDYDVKNTLPSTSILSTLFPTEQASDCPKRMMGLSHDWGGLKNKIDDLEPAGMTNQPIGLAWAWMALTPNGPLNAPAKTADTQQVIVLFSDGLNTENRWTDDQKKIDERQAIACTNAKAAGITIYTVLVMSGYSKVMKDCASKPEYYYEITQANQTVAVFNAIGKNLSKLRIAN